MTLLASSENQHEMQESNFNPRLHPHGLRYDHSAIEMPPPDYDFPSNVQTNTYGANNHMTPSNSIQYSLAGCTEGSCLMLLLGPGKKPH